MTETIITVSKRTLIINFWQDSQSGNTESGVGKKYFKSSYSESLCAYIIEGSFPFYCLFFFLIFSKLHVFTDMFIYLYVYLILCVFAITKSKK